MSKNRKDRRQSPYDIDNYWQSAGYNSELFIIYRQQIMKLAMNRYKWINLPITCNERYLEYTLLTQGIATIAFPKSKEEYFTPRRSHKCLHLISIITRQNGKALVTMVGVFIVTILMVLLFGIIEPDIRLCK